MTLSVAKHYGHKGGEAAKPQASLSLELLVTSVTTGFSSLLS